MRCQAGVQLDAWHHFSGTHGDGRMVRFKVDGTRTFIARGIDTLLVDDRVNGDGGLASLTIANNQLTLSTAHRHQ